MNSIQQHWFKRRVLSSMFIGMLCAVSAYASADTYNVVLKQNGTPLTCTTGGFSFTKTSPGTFPATGLSISVAANCIPASTGGFIPAATFSTGSPNLTVQNVTMNGQNQGPNVEGLAGNVTNGGTGASLYTIKLAYSGDGNANITRTFTITRNGGQAGQVAIASGTYYLRNTKSIPEPETVLLLLVGVGALALARRIRRKASA